MSVKIYTAPIVCLLSKPVFIEPPHIQVNWRGEASDGEKLAEFGGRLCYMSQHNPAERTTADYIKNIKAQRHFSVTEHANYTLLFEGISRSLSHEAVRHRHISPSQLSQRYVDSADTAFVIPPAFIGNDLLERTFAIDMLRARDQYEFYADALAKEYTHITNGTERRKKAREAARCVLPNATETKMIMTGNVRAWRHFVSLRANAGADREIYRLARAVHTILLDTAPSFFDDYALDAQESLVPEYTEV